MARSHSNQIPSPETVLLEFSLAPPATLLGVAAVARRQEYRVVRTTQVDAYDSPLTAADVRAAARPPGELFGGTARKAAKLSVASAPMEEFDDLKKLMDTLPAHNAMAHHQPKIKTDAASNRVAEEKRNVRVRAFLYAASREDDNDFHLIIGRAPELPELYMTVEISGLPPASSASRAKLQAARTAYKAFFEPHPLGLPGTSYDFYLPPIPVTIEWSLFFDMSHATGSRPGPQDLRSRMPVVWEIHPVTKIKFEP